MNNNIGIYSILGLLFLFIVFSFIFNILGFLLMLLIKYWYIWLIIVAIIYLTRFLKGESNVKKYHNDGKDYIDAEYRVEGEDDEKK